ncbi:MAG: DUF5916 domain-containing protein [Lacibacter sp.]
MRRLTLFTLLTLLSLTCLFAQTSKVDFKKEKAEARTLPALRTTQKVKIDGLLNDSAWKQAAVATNYVEFRPKVGRFDDEETKTVTYLMYDDEGFYFGGYCYERSKDSIATELIGKRDGFGTNDYIGIIIDTYKDHLNGFEYFVTPLNEQWDAKMSPNSNGNSEDFSWNAVWKSGAVIHDNGWSFEMFIPYSAIRFGKKDVQDWGINMTRRKQKTGQQNTWNPIDPNVNGFLTQEGYWTGISNIKPPVRLQLSPYFSIYTNHYPLNQAGVKNTTTLLNGGLDLKYGLNQAFTLDATLIPDFGQVQSDNQVLNLSPFEVQYNEYRPFFTEGTELFSKGNLFYSRRIGGTPFHYYDAMSAADPSTEKLLKNPSQSKLLNATKISGRTQKKLGIGFLNAITQTQYADIENTTTKEHRKYLTDPLTNYNVFVLDQSLKNNSSVTLINTNVMRGGADYDANVTAGLFDLNDKKNTWNVGGKVAVSQLFGATADNKTEAGYNHNFYFGKVSGKFNFNVYQELMDKKYTNRDLGYFTNNNYINHGLWAGYNWNEPKNWHNQIRINFNASISHLYARIPSVKENFQTASFNTNFNIQSKKLWWFGGYVGFLPVNNDFYEPRKEGFYFGKRPSINYGVWIESNSAKKYSFYTEIFHRHYFNFYKANNLDISFGHNMRFGNKLSVSQRINLVPQFNNIGFSAFDTNDDIIFARRKRNTIENTLQLKYSFTNKMGITYRMRHYVSIVDNKEFFTLQQNGKLTSNQSFAGSMNQNVNFFNIDMVYTWEFAPGSFLNVVWKNNIYTSGSVIERDYFKNLGDTWQADQNNNLSIKLIYFLDYQTIKNWGKK